MSDKNFKVKNGLDANGAVTITQPNTSTVPLTILANTLATGPNLLEVKRPDGTVRLSIGNDGAFSAQNLVAYNARFYSAQTDSSGLIIRGLPSQTADLQQWRDINETVLASVSASGSITAVDLTLSGNLTVNGTTTNLNSTNLVIEDKNIIIADVATPTDTTADGAGITIKGATDKTFNWVQSTGSFTSSEPLIINTNSTTRPNLILKPIASQTSAVQEWQSSTGAVLANIDKSGYFRGPLVEVSPTNPALYGVAIAANASQTGDLFQITDSSNNAYTGVSSTGKFVTGNTTNISRFTQITDAALGQLTVYSPSASTKGLVIKGAASQTADLQQWQDNSGNILGRFHPTAGFLISSIANTNGGAAPYLNINTTSFELSTNTATNKGLVIKAASSQTANLQEWQNNSGSVLANIDSTGRFLSTRPFRTDDVITAGSQTTTLGQISAIASSSSRIGLAVRGAASQTANLQEWQDSSGTILASINAAGALSLNYASSSTLTTPLVLDNSAYGTGTGTQIVFRYGGLNYASISSIYSGTPSGPDMVFNVGSTTSSRMRIDNNGTVTINGFNASAQGLIVRAAVSQTADLQQWQNSNSVALARIDQNGNIFATNNLYVRNGGNDYAAAVNFGTGFNATKGLVLRGVASQTANLMEWQNSAATVLTSVDASGNITAPSYNLSDSKYLLRKTIKKTVDPAGNAIANNTYDLFDMNFPSSLQGTFYIQASIRGGGYGQNLTYSLPATYVMDWLNQYPITNPFTNSTTWVDLTPLTFSPRHLMTNDYFKFQAKINLNQISFRIKLTGTLTGSPLFDIYIQHSEEFANTTITELNTTGTDSTTSNVMPNFLSSKAGLSAIFNPITLYSNNSTNIPLTIKGATSQTANLQEWQDSSGNILARIAYDGKLTIGYGAGGGIAIGSTSFSGVTYNGISNPSGVTSYPTLVIKGISSQTADLQQWHNSGGTAVASINLYGKFTTNSDLQVNSASRQGTTATAGWNTFATQNNSYASIGVIAMAGQTANLQEWQDSTGAILSKIDYRGWLILPASNRFVLGGGIGDFAETGAYLLTGSSNITIGTRSASNKGLIIQGAASQTQNLTEWQNSAGTTLGYFDPYGSLVANGNIIAGSQMSVGIWGFLAAQVGISSALTTRTSLIVKGIASQTANFTEWQNSSGTVLAKVDANGNFSAISKSFDIPHPTKENMRLRYASIEGPENGVYIRGTAESNIIELPEYWTGLVHENSITVSLTAVGSAQNIYVEKIEDNKVYIGGEFIKAFFTVYGERKDIDKLTVEY